eukprot:TRINITY_DN14987_c0_g1::TRINITY_DN14987_c0_g1_i1::g.25769::m.25769 TRINITY_DN14987_c0_g1::TRINITY_DN14987_c0_g1_i1::g.25769  ORF type:complete len:170 (-),score=16.91,sp/D0L3V5/MSHD_GORB4/30.08/2e-08,Acetyltransf_1/PF00583.19/1.4e-12,Acetyltransf_7/PF13508.1/4.1e-11,Acetyltransf_4/PF13420.1/5.3e-08,Acetyltransf_10/PF13673.1/5.7e-07,Acetyltransf_CG/PF14542.1/1.2e-06,Acetyltransf_3/PF13302.1/2.1e-05,Acetyltransf_8/PF13523.1/0.00037,Acetyltransf_9/PF13527.1/0.00058,FR47/PF08445.5/1.8e+03,FR47/PF0844
MIRRATMSDLPEILRITNAAYVDSHYFKKPYGYDRITMEMAQDHFANPNGLYLVCTEESTGKILGSVEYTRNHDSVYFGALSVDPPLQGHGIARKLIHAVEDLARSEGKKKCEICVVELQTHLLELYKKFGYSICGRAPWPADGPLAKDKLLKDEFINTEFILMEKNLD